MTGRHIMNLIRSEKINKFSQDHIMIYLANNKKIWLFKTLALILGFLSIGLVVYMIFLPLYPLIKYQIIQFRLANNQSNRTATSSPLYLALISAKPPVKPPAQPLSKPLNSRLAAGIVKQSNRVIIKKIGVNSPIVEAPEDKWQSALNKGAWRLPQTSTPDRGGNTVISAHRYKYLPPNNLTFYLLDKLAAGDIVNIVWENKEYSYRVTGSKIVPPTEISILDPTERPTLTLFTCDPIWTEKNRLVVVAELIK